MFRGLVADGNWWRRNALLLVYIFLAAVGSGAAAHYLSWFAPWRTTEIYLCLFPLFLLVGLAWRLARAKPRLRLLLIAGLLSLNALDAAMYYRAYKAHHDNEFPALSEHLPAELSKTAVGGVMAEAGHRGRLFQFLNDSPADSQVLIVAGKIMKNEYSLFGYKAVRLPTDLDWQENPVDDHSWNWDLHNMHYVATLARAYELTGEIAYLAKAEALVLDWIAKNNAYIFYPLSQFSWNEHSTAFRLMNWLYFFDLWKISSLASQPKVETVFRSILGHAKLQSLQSFYFDNHNHGIDQDRSLMAFALMHPETKESAQWLQLSLDRITKQFKFAVSPRGVHLEHSPGYHLYGMQQMQRTQSFLNAWRIKHPITEELAKKIEHMAQFVPNIVKPDGNLVQLGDTPVLPITKFKEQLAPLTGNFPLLQQLTNSGNTQLVKDGAKAFMDEGYVVIRDFNGGTLNFKNSTYLFFTAGAHNGRGHRQADDLSFTLSANGRELLSDPGVYSYKHDAARQYVIGTAAHNTVLVDGTSYKGWDTRLDHFTEGDSLTLIKSSHRNYSNLEHVRRIVYLKPSLIFVIDSLHPLAGAADAGVRKFEQLFHFPADLKVELYADRLCALIRPIGPQPESSPVLKICQLGAVKPTLRVALGEKAPLQGWHSPAHATLVAAPALVSRLDAKVGEYVTVLELLQPTEKGTSQNPPRNDFRLVRNGNLMDIRWHSGTDMQTLSLDMKQDIVTVH